MMANITDIDEQPPKIEFPCEDYPIKVMGPTAPDFKQAILDIIKRHAPELDESTATVKASAKGNYLSLGIKILATGEPQLQAIFEDLKSQRPGVDGFIMLRPDAGSGAQMWLYIFCQISQKRLCHPERNEGAYGLRHSETETKILRLAQDDMLLLEVAGVCGVCCDT